MLLPSFGQIRAQIPLSSSLKESIESHRAKLQALLSPSSVRSIPIVLGPCSIHDPQAAICYAERIERLQRKYEGIFWFVMRVFFEKPRSLLGWKGWFSDPLMDNSFNIEKGLIEGRSLLKEIGEMHIPMATEFLDPLFSPYISDFITWGFIGARTSSSPLHRQLASSLPMPVGLKNNQEGDLLLAIQGVEVSRSSHTFPSLNEQGQLCVTTSQGNPWTHLVLRGDLQGPNHHLSFIKKAELLHRERGITPRILIDTGHGNRRENPQTIFLSALENAASLSSFLGFMIESFLFPGSQPPSPSSLLYGVSVTDPCLGIKETEELLDKGAFLIEKTLV